MGLDTHYARQIRSNLSCFPVWPPGESVAPGDVGVLGEGLFTRETTLSALFPDLRFSVAQGTSPHPSNFFSKDCVIGRIAARGKVDPNVRASIAIDFKQEGGVVFDASACTVDAIDDILAVRRHIGENRDRWPSGMVLVSHVERSPRFAVLISQNAGARVELSGDLAPLQQVRIADASVAVSSASGLGYQRTGEGPVTLRLYGFKWWSAMPGLLSADAPQPDEASSEFAELSARDPGI